MSVASRSLSMGVSIAVMSGIGGNSDQRQATRRSVPTKRRPLANPRRSPQSFMRTPYGGSERPEGQSEEQVPYRGVDMRRTVFNEDHEAFRQVLRDFIEAEVTPHYQEWHEAGIVPRDFYYKLA